MNRKYSQAAIWAAIVFVLVTAFGQFGGGDAATTGTPTTYSDLLAQIQSKNIKEATIEGEKIVAVTNSGTVLTATTTSLDRGLIGDLRNNDVKFDIKAPARPSFLSQVFISWFPMLLLIGVWIFFMKKGQGKGGMGGMMSVGKSKARMLDEKTNLVTFADVAGCDEAKEEVAEIVEFLREPRKFQQLGGRVPHGVLMVGPPGTGKTLLARAIAGEAKVPFFTISGSDFVEMFVGVGASRVRDMFANAKQHAPCIIFIDEIDAVGRHRGSGTGGGNDEREQTLNQMLVEMDGFEANSGVIVIAATNRADVLDKALLRPGRFDRQVMVGLPDIRGREQVLNVHMRKIPAAADVEANTLARGTPGFSGADLANLVNEAALFAARRGSFTSRKRMSTPHSGMPQAPAGLRAPRGVVVPTPHSSVIPHPSSTAWPVLLRNRSLTSLGSGAPPELQKRSELRSVLSMLAQALSAVNIVGTPKKTVTRFSAIAAIARSGSKRRCSTLVAASRTASSRLKVSA